MSISRFITLLAGFTLLCSFAGNAQVERKITIGLVIFPPLILQDCENGDCSGPAVEISKSVFTQAGFEVEIYCAPAARLYSLIQEGKVDVTINVNSTSAIKQHVDFHTVPFAKLKVALLTNLSLPDVNTVSAIRGFDYHGVRQNLLEQNFTFVDLPNGNDAVHVFLRSRTGGLLTYMRPYRYLIARSTFPIPDNIHVEEMLELETYFGISKSSPWHDDILSALDSYVEKNKIIRFSGVETLP
ncbi:substrate-binding periplasmic protein [Alteromonas sp. H39]|uniref:substrate-binding periplasmic protein n=1 Tax=Alteromonas sp. H39 TaxID=3389876 RepID=UPI0039E079AF